MEVFKCFFLLGLVFIGQISFSQKSHKSFFKKDIVVLNSRVYDLYVKSSENLEEEVHIINVLDAYCPFENKEMFQDTSFLNYLEFAHIKIRREKYLASHSIICNAQDSVVGHCWYYSCGNNPPQYLQSFVDTINSHNIEHVFKFYNGLHNSFYIAIDSDMQVYLIDSKTYGFRVYPINKCTDFQWEYITKGKERLDVDAKSLRTKVNYR